MDLSQLDKLNNPNAAATPTAAAPDLSKLDQLNGAPTQPVVAGPAPAPKPKPNPFVHMPTMQLMKLRGTANPNTRAQIEQALEMQRQAVEGAAPETANTYVSPAYVIADMATGGLAGGIPAALEAGASSVGMQELQGQVGHLVGEKTNNPYAQLASGVIAPILLHHALSHAVHFPMSEAPDEEPAAPANPEATPPAPEFRIKEAPDLNAKPEAEKVPEAESVPKPKPEAAPAQEKQRVVAEVQDKDGNVVERRLMTRGKALKLAREVKAKGQRLKWRQATEQDLKDAEAAKTTRSGKAKPAAPKGSTIFDRLPAEHPLRKLRDDWIKRGGSEQGWRDYMDEISNPKLAHMNPSKTWEERLKLDKLAREPAPEPELRPVPPETFKIAPHMDREKALRFYNNWRDEGKTDEQWLAAVRLVQKNKPSSVGETAKAVKQAVKQAKSDWLPAIRSEAGDIHTGTPGNHAQFNNYLTGKAELPPGWQTGFYNPKTMEFKTDTDISREAIAKSREAPRTNGHNEIDYQREMSKPPKPKTPTKVPKKMPREPRNPDYENVHPNEPDKWVPAVKGADGKVWEGNPANAGGKQRGFYNPRTKQFKPVSPEVAKAAITREADALHEAMSHKSKGHIAFVRGPDNVPYEVYRTNKGELAWSPVRKVINNETGNRPGREVPYEIHRRFKDAQPEVNAPHTLKDQLEKVQGKPLPGKAEGEYALKLDWLNRGGSEAGWEKYRTGIDENNIGDYLERDALDRHAAEAGKAGPKVQTRRGGKIVSKKAPEAAVKPPAETFAADFNQPNEEAAIRLAYRDTRNGRVHDELSRGYKYLQDRLASHPSEALNFEEGYTDRQGKFHEGPPPGFSRGSVAVPAVFEKARHLGDFMREMRRAYLHPLISPEKIDSSGTIGKMLIRRGLGRTKRAEIQFENTVRQVGKWAAAQPEADQNEFVDRFERGLPQKSKEWQALADMWKGMNDEWKQAANAVAKRRGVPTKRLFNQFMDNYFPHEWVNDTPKQQDQIDEVTRLYQDERARRIAGSQKFRRHRTVSDTAFGRDHGLVPRYQNPVDAIVAKNAEFQRYLNVQDMLTDLRQRGMRKFVKKPADIPGRGTAAEWMREPTEYGKISLPGKRANLGGSWGPGYYVPKSVGVMLKNYMDEGLWKYKPYRMWRVVTNHATLVKLGLSGFHWLNEAGNAFAQDIGLGLQEMGTRGMRLKGIGRLAKSPTAPLRYARIGLKIRGAIEDSGLADTPEGRMAQRWVDSNGEMGQSDREYTTQATRNFMHTVAQMRGEPDIVAMSKHVPKAAMQFVFATIDKMGDYLFNDYIPALKLGAFAEAWPEEMAKLGPDATDDAKLMATQKLTDHMDNIFGKINWDNLFWRKWLQNGLHAAMLAPGWLLGNVRVFGGAFNDIARGRLNTQRVGFLMGNMMKAYALGSLYQYAKTGTLPQFLPPTSQKNVWLDMRNIMYPLNGHIRADGTPERSQLPGYGHELMRWGHVAAQLQQGNTSALHKYASSKENPPFGLLLSLPFVGTNSDWRGEKIYDPQASWGQNAERWGQVAGETAAPIALTNLARQQAEEAAGRTSGVTATENALGINVAPQHWQSSPFRNAMYEAKQAGKPVGPYSFAQMNEMHLKSQAMAQMRQHPGLANAQQIAAKMYNAGQLSKSQLSAAWRSSKEPPIEKAVKGVKLKTIIDNWHLASDTEKIEVMQYLVANQSRRVAGLTKPERVQVGKQLTHMLMEVQKLKRTNPKAWAAAKKAYSR